MVLNLLIVDWNVKFSTIQFSVGLILHATNLDQSSNSYANIIHFAILYMHCSHNQFTSGLKNDFDQRATSVIINIGDNAHYIY